MSRAEESRVAKKCGLIRFHSDKPCRKCGGETFYVSTCACVYCEKLRNSGVSL